MTPSQDSLFEALAEAAESGRGLSQEWLELHNVLSVDVDISRWRLEGGVRYLFPEGTFIAGDGRLVVALNPGALEVADDLSALYGPYEGKLSNGGEALALFNNAGLPQMASFALNENNKLRSVWPRATS